MGYGSNTPPVFIQVDQGLKKEVDGLTTQLGGLYTNGKNLFDVSKVTAGYYVSETDGTIKANSAYSVSGFIDIDGDTAYLIEYINSKSTSGLRYAIYDAAKVFITGAAGAALPTNTPVPLSSPSNAKYIVFSYTTGRTNVQLEKGTVETAYEPYGRKTLAISVAVDKALTETDTPADSKTVGDKFTALKSNITIDAVRTTTTLDSNIANLLAAWTPEGVTTWVADRWKIQGSGYLSSTAVVESGAEYLVEVEKANVINQDPGRRPFTISFNGENIEIFGNSDETFIFSRVFTSSTSGAVNVKVGSDNWAGEITNISIRKVLSRPSLPFKINGIGTRMAGNNVSIGDGHAYLTTGTLNTAFGFSAQKRVDTGHSNSAFGYGAQTEVKGGSFNNAFGRAAQGILTTGMYNNAFGVSTQAHLTSGCWNTAIGNEAQRDLTTGDNNISIGRRASNSMTTGSGNVHIGARSGLYPFATTTASFQTFLGFQTSQMTSAQDDYLTAIGYQATGRKYATALGASTVAGAAGAVAIGADSTGAGASTSNQDEIALGTALHRVKIAGKLNVARYTPSSSSDAQGQVGDITSDDNFTYVKASTGWKRSALTSW